MTVRSNKSASGTAVLVAVVSCLAGSGPRPAQADSAAEGQVVQLPPFFVDDSSLKFSVWNWGYMAFQDYEVLTYCNRTTTNSFVAGIANQLSLFHEIAPAAFETQPSVPTALILMDISQEQAISEDMKKAMNERPADTNTGMSGLTSHRIYLPQLRLHDSESTTINLVLGNLEHLDVVVLEPIYVRYLMEARTPRLPSWYVEAMTNLYRRAVFGAASVTFSPISWTNEQQTVALQEDPGHPFALLPMDLVLFTRPGSGGSDEAEKTRVRLWECQSELFLQWVLSDKGRHRTEALKRFIDCGDRGERSERALMKCFGLGYAQLQAQLRGFLPKAVTQPVTFYAHSDGMKEPLRDATPAEFARIWGNWELMEIQFVTSEDPLLVHPYLAQADHTLRNGYKRGERDPGLLAVLGLYDVDTRDLAQARPILEAAAASRAPYPRVYVELARMRLADACAAPKGPQGKLSADQVTAVIAPLQAARRLSPPQGATYLLYALALANSSVAPTEADLAALHEGLLDFPGEPILATTVAALNETRRAGTPPAASKAR